MTIPHTDYKCALAVLAWPVTDFYVVWHMIVYYTSQVTSRLDEIDSLFRQIDDLDRVGRRELHATLARHNVTHLRDVPHQEAARIVAAYKQQNLMGEFVIQAREEHDILAARQRRFLRILAKGVRDFQTISARPFRIKLFTTAGEVVRSAPETEDERGGTWSFVSGDIS